MEDLITKNEDFFRSLTYLEYNVTYNIWGSSPPSLQCIILTRLVIEPWREVLCSEVKDISYASGGGLDLRPLQDTDSLEFKVLKRISTSILSDYVIKDLKHVIYRMGQEINRAVDDFSQKVTCYSFASQLLIYFENLTWTQQGTVDYARTATQIIDLPNISIHDKYILTSEYCIEEKIRSVLPKFESCNKYYNRVVAYWMRLINDDFTTFSKDVHATPTYEYLCVQEDYANKMEESLVEYARMIYDLPFMNKKMLLLDLLMKMTQTQVDEICVNMGLIVVKAFHSTSEWHNLFVPAAKYVLSHISKMNAWSAADIAIFCWDAKIFDLKKYENVWYEIGNIKDFEDNFYSICDLFVKNVPNTKTTYAPTLKFLLSNALPHVYNNLWSLVSLGHCKMILDLIMNGKFGILNTFLTEILGNEEVAVYIQEHIVDNSSDICFKLIHINNGKWFDEFDYKMLDEFVYNFYTIEERDRVCNELPYRNNAAILSNILLQFPHDKKLEAIDYFLNWCFKGNKGEAAKCKAVLFDLDSELYSWLKNRLFDEIESYISYFGEWENAEKYLMWLLCANYDVATWKQKLIRIREIVSCGEIDISSARLLAATFCFDEGEVDELKKVIKRM